MKIPEIPLMMLWSVDDGSEFASRFIKRSVEFIMRDESAAYLQAVYPDNETFCTSIASSKSRKLISLWVFEVRSICCLIFCFHVALAETSDWSKHFKLQSAIWKLRSKRSQSTKDLQQLSRFQLPHKCVGTFLNTKLTASGYERKFSPHSNIMICWWWKRNEYQNNSRTLWGIHRLTRIEVISFQLQLRWQWMRSRKVWWKINQIKSSLSFVWAFIEKLK